MLSLSDLFLHFTILKSHPCLNHLLLLFFSYQSQYQKLFSINNGCYFKCKSILVWEFYTGLFCSLLYLIHKVFKHGQKVLHSLKFKTKLIIKFMYFFLCYSKLIRKYSKVYSKKRSSLEVNSNLSLLPFTPRGNKIENVIGWDCSAELILTAISRSFSSNI